MAENKLSDEQKPEALREFAADVRSEVAPPNFTAGVVECCADTIEQLRTRCRELERLEDYDQNWAYCPSCDRPTKPSMMDDEGFEESCCKLCLENDQLRTRCRELEAFRKWICRKIRIDEDSLITNIYGEMHVQMIRADEHSNYCNQGKTQWHQDNERLRSQLAAVTAERDELRGDSDAT